MSTGSNICVLLMSPPAYSETFLQAHVNGLGGAVNYLERLPFDPEREYAIQPELSGTEKLKLALKASAHRYLINVAKQVYLRYFFKREGTRVVLAEYGVTGGFALGICRQLEIPLVIHFHGYDAYARPIIEKYQEVYKEMFAYCSAIVVVSQHMAEQLVKLGAPREKIYCNAYGVDIERFKQASLLGGRPQVVAVGRFVPKKAPYLTILAFQKVLAALPEARLVMVGDGVLRDMCSRIVRSLHMEHAVELRGAVEHDQVAELMQQSRLFVQHSLTAESGDSEGTPVAILEAGASGLPVVSTRHGGITDAVIHGQTGYLVEEGDIEGMADYMYRLLVQPELARDMGQRARQYISEHFNMAASINNLRALLEKYAL